MPKGYQISQYELPLASNGALEIETEAGVQRIGITRAHLEEDTAKLYHQDDGSALVDFNRAGVPLIEIVSEPDMHSVEAVQAYATTLRDVLVYLGINAGDMEKGEMRFEANVSIRPIGTTTLGTRTEIKNLNSFRALASSVAYEIERQKAVFGRAAPSSSRRWDGTKPPGGRIHSAARKSAHDYRYFPGAGHPAAAHHRPWVAEVRCRAAGTARRQARALRGGLRPEPQDAASWRATAPSPITSRARSGLSRRAGVRRNLADRRTLPPDEP